MAPQTAYFEDYYRIWKVGSSAKERLAFWNENFLRTSVTDTVYDDDSEALKDYEFLHLTDKGLVGEDPEHNYPTPQEIHIEKYYWEHGVVADRAGRLRYFRSHHVEHFILSKTTGQTEEKILADCEMFFIVETHEAEIDPNV